MNTPYNVALVRNYVAALQSGAVGEQLASFFTPRCDAGGAAHDTTFRYRQRSRSRRSGCRRSTLGGSAGRTGGRLAAGAEMRAHFAMFFEFRNGLIYKQRNYDCFEPCSPDGLDGLFA